MSSKGLVTVTGASGFIALHTIKKLLEKGYSVRGTVRDTSRIEGLLFSLSRHCDVSGLSFMKADLNEDAGWVEAMDGARYLLHMASPLPAEAPKNEDDLIIPARDGALRAIKAAVTAGVSRIVMTSSIAAVSGGHDKDVTLNEMHWSDITKDIGAYQKSKTIAEQAAWDFINALPRNKRPEFAVINPGFVLGPLIDADTSASHEVVRRLMAREVPGVPNIGFSLVDVRDVADAHISALETPAAPGSRYICVSELISFRDMAKMLHDHLEPRGYKIPQRPVPDWLVRLLANFSPTFKVVASRLGPSSKFNTSLTRTNLNWQPMPMHQSLLETADSLIDHKIV